MPNLEIVPLAMLGWDFRVETEGSPPTTLEPARFRDRSGSRWSSGAMRPDGTTDRPPDPARNSLV